MAVQLNPDDFPGDPVVGALLRLFRAINERAINDRGSVAALGDAVEKPRRNVVAPTELREALAGLGGEFEVGENPQRPIARPSPLPQLLVNASGTGHDRLRLLHRYKQGSPVLCRLLGMFFAFPSLQETSVDIDNCSDQCITPLVSWMKSVLFSMPAL